jgi:hypothetical protein
VTFHAIRLARAVTGRRYLIKFQGCYHGWHDAVAMNVISARERMGGKDLLSQGTLPEVAEATLVVPFNDAQAVERALEEHAGRSRQLFSSPSRTTSARCCRCRVSWSACGSCRRNFPGLAIMLVVLGFNFLGDGLRDILDPRLHEA